MSAPNVYAVSGKMKDQLQSWRSQLTDLASEDYLDEQRYEDAATIAQAFLTRSCTSAINDAAQDLSANPVLIRGIPVADDCNDLADRINNLLLIGILASAGLEVFSYREQNAGQIAQNVIPIPGKEDVDSSAGRVPLGWHTDDAVIQRNYRAEGIALLCVNNDAGSRTYFINVNDIIGRLGQRTVTILTEPRFRFATPESFNIFGGKLVYSELRPILTPQQGSLYEVACAEYSTIASRTDKDALSALHRLRSTLADDGGTSQLLQPGDCFVFSNVRGLHSRDAIVGRRHLKRAYFRRNLDNLRALASADDNARVFNCQDFILL